MNNFLDIFRDKWRFWNACERLIFVIIAFFIVTKLLFFISGKSLNITHLLYFSSDFENFVMRPWSIITYLFSYTSVESIVWNLLFLFGLGKIFMNLFNGRLFLNIFFISGMFGALISFIYSSVISIIPIPLLGIYPSIFGLITFICIYSPHTNVRFFIVDIKLWHIAAVLIVIELIKLCTTFSNIYIANLSGVILGFWYANQLKKGKDIGVWFTKMMDWFVKMLP